MTILQHFGRIVCFVAGRVSETRPSREDCPRNPDLDRGDVDKIITFGTSRPRFDSGSKPLGECVHAG